MNPKIDMAPKGAYKRKLDVSPKVNENLKCNLLLIREAFRAFQHVPLYSTTICMEIFYKALGLYIYDEPQNATANQIKQAQTKAIRKASDIYSKFIDGIPNNKYFGTIQKGLIDAGLPERFIRKDRTARMLVDTEIDILVDEYFIEETKKETTELAKMIQWKLMEKYLKKDKEACNLVMVVYKLINLVIPNETQDLYAANEVLEKVLENNLPTKVKNSSTYARYINTLAQSVISVEEEFPNFYALTQQMRQEKTPQSIMDETTKILKQLQDAVEISKSDAESTSCQNMINEVTKVMLKIQQVLNPETIQKNPVK